MADGKQSFGFHAETAFHHDFSLFADSRKNPTEYYETKKSRRIVMYFNSFYEFLQPRWHGFSFQMHVDFVDMVGETSTWSPLAS
jgi:hypothetical protein